jgi:preprotein translocase subunit SecD
MKKSPIKKSLRINWQRALVGTASTVMLTLVSCGEGFSVSESPFICPFAGVELTLQIEPPSSEDSVTPELIKQVREVLNARIEELDSTKAAVVPIESNKILIQLEGSSDTANIEQLLTQTAQLQFRQQRLGTEAQLQIEQQLRQQLQREREILTQRGDEAALTENQAAIERSNQAMAFLFEPTTLTGEHLTDVYAQPTQSGDNWQISIRFDDQGSEDFAQLTQMLAGTGRSIGIFLDEVLISAPTVGPEYAETGITGGVAVIPGNFTLSKANDLAIQLRSGALPASIEVVSVQTVENNRCTTPIEG